MICEIKLFDFSKTFHHPIYNMNKSTTTTNQWWHDDITNLAAQLSRGVLNEMKRRIQTSNIQKEKLQLNENTERMRQFFMREVRRYTKRKETMRLKQLQQPATDNSALYQEIIRKLIACNESLVKKCKSHFIVTERVHLWSTIFTQQ
jgi:hypothetical protein